MNSIRRRSSSIGWLRADLLLITDNKMYRKQHQMITIFLALALMFTLISAQAEQLWNNGETDGSNTLNWGQYSSTLDDFYVPGGGWFIESATTRGFFLDDGQAVNDVKIYIWPHNMDTGEPDGDKAYSLPVKDFVATQTGD